MQEEFDLLRSKLFVSLLPKNNSTSLLTPPATQAGKLNKMESTEKIKARWFPLTVVKGQDKINIIFLPRSYYSCGNLFRHFSNYVFPLYNHLSTISISRKKIIFV